VFYDERIVIVAEQRPDASEEDSFQWMSRVLQVLPSSLHQTPSSTPPKSINMICPSLLWSTTISLSTLSQSMV